MTCACHVSAQAWGCIAPACVLAISPPASKPALRRARGVSDLSSCRRPPRCGPEWRAGCDEAAPNRPQIPLALARPRVDLFLVGPNRNLVGIAQTKFRPTPGHFGAGSALDFRSKSAHISSIPGHFGPISAEITQVGGKTARVRPNPRGFGGISVKSGSGENRPASPRACSQALFRNDESPTWVPWGHVGSMSKSGQAPRQRGGQFVGSTRRFHWRDRVIRRTLRSIAAAQLRHQAGHPSVVGSSPITQS